MSACLFFEGIDGAGKSTVAAMLYDYLVSKGVQASLYKEPYHEIPPDSSPLTQMLFYTASRSWLFEKRIRPDLEQNKIVLVDRSYVSTFVYQCMLGGVDYFLTVELNRVVLCNTLPEKVKSYIILLDTPPEVAYKRKSEQDLETLKKLRDVYLKLLSGNAFIINASNDLDIVFNEVKMIVDEIVRETL